MKRHRKFRTLFTTLASAALLVLGISTSPSEGMQVQSSISVPKVEPEQHLFHLGAAGMLTAETVGTSNGTGADELDQPFEWHDEFARFVEGLRSGNPDSFVAAGIEDGGGYDAWIALNAESELAAELEQFSVEVEVEARRVSELSETEQVAALDAVHYSVFNAGGVEDAVSGLDPLTGTIEIEYALSADVDSAEVSVALDQVINDALEPWADDMNVEREEMESIPGGTEQLYGGAWLMQGGEEYCTSGFTVTQGDLSGILTAGHCEPPMAYEGSTSLMNIDATPTSQGDLRWLSSAEPITNQVYSSATSTISITATGGAVVGQTLQFYGRSSGPSSDTVIALNQCANLYCNLTMVESHQTQDGDSGGPWRSGNIAHGVHHGWTTYDGSPRALFTRVGLANTALSVVINTTP